MSSVNVLSIDGGGIRGVVSAEVLIYVEKKLQDGNYLRVEPILRKDVDDEMSNASKKNIERLDYLE